MDCGLVVVVFDGDCVDVGVVCIGGGMFVDWLFVGCGFWWCVLLLC